MVTGARRSFEPWVLPVWSKQPLVSFVYIRVAGRAACGGGRSTSLGHRYAADRRPTHQRGEYHAEAPLAVAGHPVAHRV